MASGAMTGASGWYMSGDDGFWLHRQIKHSASGGQMNLNHDDRCFCHACQISDLRGACCREAGKTPVVYIESGRITGRAMEYKIESTPAPLPLRLELRRGIFLMDVRQIEDLHRFIPGGPDEVIYIHGMRFIPHWENGSLVLTPKSAEDMAISAGMTRDEYLAASTDKVLAWAKKAWRAAGLPFDGWSEKK